MLVKKCNYISGFRFIRIKTNWESKSNYFCKGVVNCIYSDETGTCQLDYHLKSKCGEIGMDDPSYCYSFIPDQKLYKCYLNQGE